jgi:hypothetical protein
MIRIGILLLEFTDQIVFQFDFFLAMEELGIDLGRLLAELLFFFLQLGDLIPTFLHFLTTVADLILHLDDLLVQLMDLIIHLIIAILHLV